MRFLRPDNAEWLLVLPLLIGAALLRWYARRSFRRAAIAPRLAPLFRMTTGRRDLAMVTAGLLAAAAIVLALLRPQVRSTEVEPELLRTDLIVMLDRSASMRARDIRPSRAVRATSELRALIETRPAGLGRIALVGFADSSVVLSYLTDDVESLLFYLDWIDADDAPMLGTNIGAALDSAMAVAQRDRRNTPKTFLLLSDGEDQSGELTKALAKVAAARYHVHAIGIGSDDAVPIPIPASSGRTVYLRDDAGRPVTTRFSERTLRRVADVTGGMYLRSSSGGELAPALRRVLDREQTIVGRRETIAYRDVYLLALAAASVAATVVWLFT